MNRILMTFIAGCALALGQTPPAAPMPPMPPEPVLAPQAPMTPMPAMPALAPMGHGPLTPPAMPPMPAFAPMPPMPAMPPMGPMPAMPPMPALAPFPDIDMDIDISGPVQMAMMFAPQEREAQQAARDAVRAARDGNRVVSRTKSSDDSDYRRGMAYLDRRDYDKAVDAFNRVIENKGDRADGAMYWRAYAQNKLGKYDESLATTAELQKAYPQSRWIEDSKALEVEVRTSKGQPPSPENVSDEDLKLLALRSLMETDPERSMPILEKLLKSSASPHLKEHALFVLAQSRSPKAKELLAQIAKGATNPDVQLKALQYLGTNPSKENLQLLGDVYKSSNDVHIKRTILQSFMVAHDRDALLQAARNETNQDLRLEAIRQLGVMGGASELYATESSPDAKRAILNGMMVSGDATKLFEVAKTEKDAKLRAYAINQLAVMGRSKTGDSLLAMYRQETDASVKEAIVNALFIQQNAPALIDIARKETDPGVKKRVVSQLAVMHSKEASDYMLELLNK